MRLSVLSLLLAAITGPPAHAELSEDYRALLVAADRTQSDEDFLETLELLAALTPGGRMDVQAAVAELSPRRLDLLEGWVVPAEVSPVLADASVTLDDAATGQGVASAQPVAAGTPPRTAAHDDRWSGLAEWVHPAHWDGRVKLGLAIDQGNTDQTDYNVALELRRPLNGGWGLDSKAEYYYTENAGATTRDRLFLQVRGEQPSVDQWSYFVGSSYEQDRMSGFEYAAILAAGGTYHPLDSERQSWILRAGPGVRHRVPDGMNGRTRWVLEIGSVYDLALSDTAQISSETTLLAGPEPRGEQRVALTTAVGGNWGVELGYRIKHEFEVQPGVDPTDSRLDFSIVREF